MYFPKGSNAWTAEGQLDSTPKLPLLHGKSPHQPRILFTVSLAIASLEGQVEVRPALPGGAHWDICSHLCLCWDSLQGMQSFLHPPPTSDHYLRLSASVPSPGHQASTKHIVLISGISQSWAGSETQAFTQHTLINAFSVQR
jgi:hypothetical protein